MDKELKEMVERELARHPSKDQLLITLTQQGYSESDVKAVLEKHKDKLAPSGKQVDAIRKNRRLFGTKEVLDRIGFGFSTQQFVNILFYQTLVGAGMGNMAYFFVGLINGLKSVLSSLLSSFLQEYRKMSALSKNFVSFGGILFGFSFLFMAFGRSKYSVPLFTASILIGSIGVVSYGDLYNKLLAENIKKERRGRFLSKITHFGLLLTAISVLFSGWLMEKIPATGKTIEIFGFSFFAYGYLLAFEITAIVLIISGYIISQIKEKHFSQEHYKVGEFIQTYYRRIGAYSKIFFASKYTFLMLTSAVLLGVVQALGNSYYGIFIFEEFGQYGFGGFLNVAVIYAVAVLASLIGPWLSQRMNKSIGYAPLLVFGTILTAMMPAVAAWNSNLYAIGIACVISIVGAAMVGFAQGLLARKLLKEEQRRLYFASLTVMVALPFLLLIPAGSWVANIYGLRFLFKLLTYVTVFVIVPLYLVLVGVANKHRL